MNIEITDKARQWFKDEVGLEEGSGVRFLGKVYGETEIHEGFSVGMEVTQPENVYSEKTIDGVTYFVEKNDEWFFSGYDLQVDFNEKQEEPIYHFLEN